ncbi:hypothetical protein [Streptomyces flaveolus]
MSKAVASFNGSFGGLGDLYAPVLSLTANGTERPELLSYIEGLGSS